MRDSPSSDRCDSGLGVEPKPILDSERLHCLRRPPSSISPWIRIQTARSSMAGKVTQSACDILSAKQTRTTMQTWDAILLATSSNWCCWRSCG